MDKYTRMQLERIKTRNEHQAMMLKGAAGRELKRKGGNIVSVEMGWAADMCSATANTIAYLLEREPQ